MKTLITIVRWTVGLLFVFSGLIKANDPLGLSYKMQEFFEAWGWHHLDNYTLALAMLMNTAEIVAGIAVIIGWQMKWVSWFLLVLIVFFTFLTGYALFSGKIKTCGCFGDCLPLTPAQSFFKDLALLLLILFLLFTAKRVMPLFRLPPGWVVLVFVTVFVLRLQFSTLKYLPFIDCLPYKTGKNIQDEMKLPPGAVPDSMSIVFQYRKNGRLIEFDQDHIPADLDSTYEYVNRTDKVVRKGNGMQPPISDFTLQTPQGTDTTAAVFAQPGKYILLMGKDMDNVIFWKSDFEQLQRTAGKKNIPVFIVTANAAAAMELFPHTTVLRCDVTVLKTAARVTPTYFVMQHATILDKRSYRDVQKIIDDIE